MLNDSVHEKFAIFYHHIRQRNVMQLALDRHWFEYVLRLVMFRPRILLDLG